MIATITSLIIVLILATIALIHIYWAFNGQLGYVEALPMKQNGETVFLPGPIPCLMVSIVFFLMSAFFLIKMNWLDFSLPNWIDQIGLWLIALVFILRSIGDFKYVGFFKKIKNTEFAKMDGRYYSPLCLFLGLGTLLMTVLV